MVFLSFILSSISIQTNNTGILRLYKHILNLEVDQNHKLRHNKSAVFEKCVLKYCTLLLVL